MQQASNTKHEMPPAPTAAQPGRAKSPAQVAGYLCTLPPFARFLREQYPGVYNRTTGPANEQDRAAQCVRAICLVQHRSEIVPGTDAARIWNDLRNEFRVWEMAVV